MCTLRPDVQRSALLLQLVLPSRPVVHDATPPAATSTSGRGGRWRGSLRGITSVFGRLFGPGGARFRLCVGTIVREMKLRK